MIIETERLLLREFKKNDWHRVYEYQNHPLYLRYTPWKERGEDDARRFVQSFLDWQSERPRRKYQFAIILRSEDRLIGNCGIRSRPPQTHEADLGYELDHNYWGHGYATEAAQALLRLGFGTLQLHRIWAWCIAENMGSAHVLEKIGMRREGHMREQEWMQGRWWDTFVYAVLNYEWQKKNNWE